MADDQRTGWLATLEVGDEVYIRTSGLGWDKYQRVTIEHITPTGIIKTEGVAFNPNGGERGRSRGWHALKRDLAEITPERERSIRKKILVSVVARFQKWDKLDFDDLQKIHSIIKNTEDEKEAQ